MGLTASSSGNSQDYELLPEGYETAKCYAVVDLGTQKTEWKGNTKKVRKVVLIWELHRHTIEIEKNGEKIDAPRVISRIFTLSLGKKSHLRPFLVSWRGKNFTPEEEKGFNIKTVLEAPCTLQIIHNQGSGDNSDTTYANVANAIPLMDKELKQELYCDPVYFSFEDNMDIPESLPDWIKEKIQQSNEWLMAGRLDDAPVQDPDYIPPNPDDDIPF